MAASRRLLPFLGVILVAMGLLVGVAPQAAAQGSVFVEGFETYTDGSQPTPANGEYVTTATGASFVNSVQPQAGLKSYRMKTIGSGTGGGIDFGAPAAFCSAPGVESAAVSFWLWMDSYDDNGVDQFWLANDANGPSTSSGDGGIILQVGAGGALSLFIRATSGNPIDSATVPTTGGFATMPLSTWVQFVIAGDCTANPDGTRTYSVFSPTLGEGASHTNTWAVGPPSNWDYFEAFLSPRVDAAVRTGYLDNVAWATSEPVEVVGSAASVTQTGIVGFDVDNAGETVIVRTNDGFVRTYDGDSLTPMVTEDTDCNISDGVSSGGANVAYLWCPSGDVDDTETFKIRSKTLGPVDVVASSESSPFGVTSQPCNDTPPTTMDWNIPDGNPDSDLSEIRNFQLYSLSFEQSEDPSGSNRCHAQVAFGASTTQGQVGVVGLFFADLVDSDLLTYESDFVQYAASGNPADHICVTFGTGAGDNNYIAAVDDATSTRFYTWNRDAVNPDIAQFLTGAGQFGSATGVGCGAETTTLGPLALLVTATQAIAMNLDTGTTPWPAKTLAGTPEARGAAMSFSGEWGAYHDGASTVKILNMTTGNVTGQVTPPGGSFVEMKLSQNGQNLWIATSTTIARYEITQITTGQPQAECSFFCPNTSGNIDTDDGGTGTGDPGTLFAGMISGLAVLLGGETAGMVAATLLLVVIMAALLGARFGEVGLILGACIGFIIALAGNVLDREWGLAVVLVLSSGSVLAFALGGRR